MSTTLTGDAARCRRTLSAQSLGWSSFLNVVGVAAWIPCSGGVFKGAHPCLAALRALGWTGGRAPWRQTPARAGRCAVQVDSGPVEVLQLFVLARCARADAATHRAGLCAHGGAGPCARPLAAPPPAAPPPAARGRFPVCSPRPASGPLQQGLELPRRRRAGAHARAVRIPASVRRPDAAHGAPARTPAPATAGRRPPAPRVRLHDAFFPPCF